MRQTEELHEKALVGERGTRMTKRRNFITKKDAKVERLPWGPHDWLSRPDLVDTRDLLVVRVNMPRGQSQGFHRQPEMEEVIYVLEGKAEQWVEREVCILRPGEVAHVPAGAAHATFNVGRGVLRFLSIFHRSGDHEAGFVDISAEEPWCDLRERYIARSPSRTEKSGAEKSAGGRRRTVATQPQRRASPRKRTGAQVVRKGGEAAKTAKTSKGAKKTKAAKNRKKRQG